MKFLLLILRLSFKVNHMVVQLFSDTLYHYFFFYFQFSCWIDMVFIGSNIWHQLQPGKALSKGLPEIGKIIFVLRNKER